MLECSYAGVVKRLHYCADQVDGEVRRFRIELDEHAVGAEGRSAVIAELTAALATCTQAHPLGSDKTAGTYISAPCDAHVQVELGTANARPPWLLAADGAQGGPSPRPAAVLLTDATPPPATLTWNGEGQNIQASSTTTAPSSSMAAMEVDVLGGQERKVEDASVHVTAAPVEGATADEVKVENAPKAMLRKCDVEDEIAGPTAAPSPPVAPPLPLVPRQPAARRRVRSMSSSSSTSGSYYADSSHHSPSPPKRARNPP